MQGDRPKFNGWMTCLGVIFICCVIGGLLALGALIAAIFAAVQTDDVLEWKECAACGAPNNPCMKGLKHDKHGCQLFHKPNGAKCESPCFRPEPESNSSAEHHMCSTTHDGYQACHMCIGSECLGTCNNVYDCPDLMNVTVDFDEETQAGPFSFGFNVTCELSMCIYEFDVALIPPFFGDASGCSNDELFHKQCKGILDDAEPFKNCLDTTTLCRSAFIDADDSFHVDACYFSFKCAPAEGLEQFKVLV